MHICLSCLCLVCVHTYVYVYVYVLSWRVTAFTHSQLTEVVGHDSASELLIVERPITHTRKGL